MPNFPIPPPPQIELITPGIVRNMLKQVFHLRVPAHRDHPAKVYPMAPFADLQLESMDWYLVERNLLQLDRDRVLKIIHYPGVNPFAGGNVIQFMDGPTPPANTQFYWISAITGDYYSFDPSINHWRSLSTKMIPFFRSPSQGTQLAPFGSSFTSYPMWINTTEDRVFLAFRSYVYVDDGSNDPNVHNIVIHSPAVPDQVVQAVNKQTREIALTSRIIAPGQSLDLRHAPDIKAKYVHATVELTHIVAP